MTNEGAFLLGGSLRKGVSPCQRCFSQNEYLGIQFQFDTKMASAGQRLCFNCEENIRLEGDFLCRSCKEEYRKCYECGQRERNHPFKLCTVCYKALSAGPAASASVPPLVPPPIFKTVAATTTGK